jgi:hypothetical protein
MRRITGSPRSTILWGLIVIGMMLPGGLLILYAARQEADTASKLSKAPVVALADLDQIPEGRRIRVTGRAVGGSDLIAPNGEHLAFEVFRVSHASGRRTYTDFDHIAPVQMPLQDGANQVKVVMTDAVSRFLQQRSSEGIKTDDKLPPHAAALTPPGYFGSAPIRQGLTVTLYTISANQTVNVSGVVARENGQTLIRKPADGAPLVVTSQSWPDVIESYHGSTLAITILGGIMLLGIPGLVFLILARKILRRIRSGG